MSLIISGKPFIKGSIKAKVPTETYSGEGDPASSVATNPYTGLSPFVTVTTIFNYTGVLQNLLLPNNAKSVSIVMWGAGGAGTGGALGTSTGGPGGFSSGGFSVSGGETLNIIVGGGGISGGLNTPNPAPGGFGGGANGGSGFQSDAGGGSGGGRSSVGINSATEIITVGGGGGGANGIGLGQFGGIGGGLSGGDAQTTLFPTTGFGGQQLAFTTGAGTIGTSDGNNTGGGGGGGGWNGGLGGNGSGSSTAGGGGSAHGEPVISNFVTIVGTSNVVAAPQNTHADYISGIGEAGTVLSAGGHGLVIVRYMS